MSFDSLKLTVDSKKGGCWLQVAGGCSSQVQINVKCLGGSPRWLLFAGGCLSRLDYVRIYGQCHEHYCFVTLTFNSKVTGGLLKVRFWPFFHILAQFSYTERSSYGWYI